MWERLARLATFAELAQLVAGASGGRGPRAAVAAHALAALNARAASAGPASASRFFWKMVLLGFHFQPVAGSFSVAAAQRLATRLGLPWRALLTQLQREQQEWPTLAATPFFARFWPLMRANASNSISEKATKNYLMPIKPAPMETTGDQAATDALLHYLLQGQLPWWAAPPAGGNKLGQQPLTTTSSMASEWTSLLRQSKHKPALKEFVRHQAHLAPVRHRLAGLADFSLLYELTAAPGPGQAQRQLVRPALASLDRVLRTEPAQPSSRFQLFLREAFLTAAVAGQAGAAPLTSSIRQLATAAGLSWHSVLAYVARLVRRLPALAAVPFFATLFREAAGAPAPFSARPKRRFGSPAPSGLAEAAGQALEHYLQTGQAAGLAANSLSTLLGAPPGGPGLVRISHYLRLAVGRQRLAVLLPTTRELLVLLRILFPVAYRQLAAPLREWLRLLAAGRVRLGTRPAALWAEVLAAAQAPWPAATLALALVRGELAASGQPLTEARLRTTSQRLMRVAHQGPSARPGALAGLLAAGLAGPAEAGSPAASNLVTSPIMTSPSRPQPPAADPTGTYIFNAGLVLLWPFLQLLFDRLSYLEQRQFKDAASAERAVHLLYFLATGEANPPEPLLLLNKLLCGVEPTRPVARELELTITEKTTGEDLLRAVLSRWEVLKNTSIAGLRETFLQRAGKLAWLPDRVTLTVETKTLDILLDRCPWSISLIKLPWMALPLYVTWR